MPSLISFGSFGYHIWKFRACPAPAHRLANQWNWHYATSWFGGVGEGIGTGRALRHYKESQRWAFRRLWGCAWCRGLSP